LAHNKSKWFEQVNFVVTQLVSYFNDRSKNFSQSECGKHFYSKDSRLTSVVDDTANALKFNDFGGLLSICFFMVVTPARAATQTFKDGHRGGVHIKHL
jgi:hypothetical protein